MSMISAIYSTSHQQVLSEALIGIMHISSHIVEWYHWSKGTPVVPGQSIYRRLLILFSPPKSKLYAGRPDDDMISI